MTPFLYHSHTILNANEFQFIFTLKLNFIYPLRNTIFHWTIIICVSYSICLVGFRNVKTETKTSNENNLH